MLKDKIYEALQAAYSESPLPLYEHLRLAGEDPSLEGKDVLLREAGVEFRKLVRRYVRGTFPKTFKDGFQSTVQGIGYDVDGYLEDNLLDVVPVSSSDFSQFKPPGWAVHSAEMKAHRAGTNHALLVTICRDTQQWSFWQINGTLGGELSVKQAPEIMSTCDAYLWSLNNKETGRTRGVFHPSEFSTSECDRALAYGLRKVGEQESIDPKLRRIFDTGHCYHDVIQSSLSHAFPGFEAEVRVSNKELRINGSCDGAFPSEDGKRNGVEIKSINLNGFTKLTKAKSEHQKQATIYGANLDLDGIYYIYACKETGEIAIYYVNVDRKLWHQQATRATNIVKTVDQGLLPPKIDKDYICKGCKFAWTCRPELSNQTKNQLRMYR